MTDEGGASQYDITPGREPEPEAVPGDAGAAPWGAGWHVDDAVPGETGAPIRVARPARRARVRYALLGGGAVVVVAVLIVAVNLSGHPATTAAASTTTSRTASDPDGAAAPQASAAGTTASTVSPTDALPSAAGDSCLTALDAMSTMIKALETDIGNSSKATADVQQAIGQIDQISAASSNAAFKHALAKLTTDLQALRGAASAGDLNAQMSGLTSVTDDSTAFVSTCAV